MGTTGTLAGAAAFFIFILGFKLGTNLGAAAGLLCIAGTAVRFGREGGGMCATKAGVARSNGALGAPPGDFFIAIRLTGGDGLDGGSFNLILLTGLTTPAGCSG